MKRKEIVIAPSGVLVELKEKRGSLWIVYQLDENQERIFSKNLDGAINYKIGIITSYKSTGATHKN